MPSLAMERKRKILQSILEDGNTIDLTNSGHFCFSCEQIFANQRCLEEHLCPLASFICSCGTEFTEYKDMLEHSTTHVPGHQMLDHQTIKKRRIEKYREEEEKLKRLEEGQVVWKASNEANLPSVSKLQVPNTSGHVSTKSASISQVPALLSNPVPQSAAVQNIFAEVGAPTVDLWTLYQPVVLLQAMQNFSKTKPYTCGKCEQGFVSKVDLVSHHSSHVADKVCGCIGCGLLLSSKKLVPRFHVCNANNQSKHRLITAKPLSYKPRPGAIAKKNQPSRPPQIAAAQQLENQNPRAAWKGGRPSPASAPKKNIRTSNSRVPAITAPLQLKSQNANASKPQSGVSMPAKTPNVATFSPGRPSARINPPVVQKSAEVSASPSEQSGFTCRVCHLPFESAQRLQRHKCVKAQEFMAKHMSAKRDYKIVKVTPSSPQINGERKLGFSPSSNTKKPQIVAVSLDKGKTSAPINGGAGGESDDDCFIVESGPAKPAEVIYQVTSSVPIKS
ncbi:PREDICTED: uncharacterized protein LOC107091651 isoform X2 [Cyprinodon variegatus]|uniref:uncharacterized protein LOC107091651 isoform X2 n=1 Tax=Cyprinodon variegatus TaxID=28743 RepID=UPI000742A353|nr:PREDICTED: uncharacterized protein LOC107091651 isoform X2 [Cyprinodon variegatus]XP_015241191.1 PREDICTED: uncharacterized protein LOC107091651 isoform X2 [Cyprinodon variegatus]